MFNNKNTAVVLTDPQVEFLKPAGGGFGLTKDILEKYNTIENMIEMVKQAKEKGYYRDHIQNNLNNIHTVPPNKVNIRIV